MSESDTIVVSPAQERSAQAGEAGTDVSSGPLNPVLVLKISLQGQPIFTRNISLLSPINLDPLPMEHRDAERLELPPSTPTGKRKFSNDDQTLDTIVVQRANPNKENLDPGLFARDRNPRRKATKLFAEVPTPKPQRQQPTKGSSSSSSTPKPHTSSHAAAPVKKRKPQRDYHWPSERRRRRSEKPKAQTGLQSCSPCENVEGADGTAAPDRGVDRTTAPQPSASNEPVPKSLGLLRCNSKSSSNLSGQDEVSPPWRFTPEPPVALKNPLGLQTIELQPADVEAGFATQSQDTDDESGIDSLSEPPDTPVEAGVDLELLATAVDGADSEMSTSPVDIGVGSQLSTPSVGTGGESQLHDALIRDGTNTQLQTTAQITSVGAAVESQLHDTPEAGVDTQLRAASAKQEVDTQLQNTSMEAEVDTQLHAASGGMGDDAQLQDNTLEAGIDTQLHATPLKNEVNMQLQISLVEAEDNTQGQDTDNGNVHSELKAIPEEVGVDTQLQGTSSEAGIGTTPIDTANEAGVNIQPRLAQGLEHAPEPQSVFHVSTSKSDYDPMRRPARDVAGFAQFVDSVKAILRAKSAVEPPRVATRQAKRILALLEIAKPPDETDALFVNGPEAAEQMNSCWEGVVVTEGQQLLPLQSIDQFLSEYYDAKTKVWIQDPAGVLGVNVPSVREVTMAQIKKRFAQESPPIGEEPWNLLELATHCDDGLRPLFLNNEDCRLLTKLKVPKSTREARRRTFSPGYKEVEKWALLAQAGALTEPHQDSHGYGTFITVNVGRLGFGWLSHPSADDRAAWCARPDAFLGDRWRYIVLSPGQTVYFPAGTVHFVFRRPADGNTLAFGGHVLRCSTLVHWVSTMLEERRAPNVTNEDISQSAPGYLNQVEKFVRQALQSGDAAQMAKWGGPAAIQQFLHLKKVFLAAKK